MKVVGWEECIPGLVELIDDAKQRIRDEELGKAAAAAEGRKPANRLITAYKRYAYVKYCNEIRQGYVLVYVNDIELERARSAVKAIEDDSLREDETLDTKALWNTSLKQLDGTSVYRDQCQLQLNALLRQNPKGSTIEKDF